MDFPGCNFHAKMKSSSLDGNTDMTVDQQIVGENWWKYKNCWYTTKAQPMIGLKWHPNNHCNSSLLGILIPRTQNQLSVPYNNHNGPNYSWLPRIKDGHYMQPSFKSLSKDFLQSTKFHCQQEIYAQGCILPWAAQCKLLTKTRCCTSCIIPKG